MARFKIFYGDGSTFSDADGTPYDAPRLNVQVIIGHDPMVGRYVVSDKDAYWWEAEEDRWRGGDRRGEWDYQVRARMPVVLWGRQISDEHYNACIAAAHSDTDFPPKTARGRGEPIVG